MICDLIRLIFFEVIKNYQQQQLFHLKTQIFQNIYLKLWFKKSLEHFNNDIIGTQISGAMKM